MTDITLFITVVVLFTLILRNALGSHSAGQSGISRKKTCLVCKSRVRSSQKLWDSLDDEQKDIIRETNEEVVKARLEKSRPS